MVKRKIMAIALIIVMCMYFVPVNVFAIINGTDTYDIELSGTNYESSDNTYSYTDTTNNVVLILSVKINDGDNYTVDPNNNRITGVLGSDEVKITITDTNSEYVGVIRGGGYSLGTPQKSDDNNTVTYTFKASELNDFTGNFMGLTVATERVNSQNNEQGEENPNPPAIQKIPKVNNTIWFNLQDALGNRLNYEEYSNQNRVIQTPEGEVIDITIGVKIMYSYDNITWYELSNFENDNKLTESYYELDWGPDGYTYCFDNDVVYIKITSLKNGSIESELAGEYKTMIVNSVYELTTKNKDYSISYTNGIRSLDWIYDMSTRHDAKEDMLLTNGKARLVKIGDVLAENYNGGKNDDDGGYFRIPAGEEVTIELVPDYGYQLSSVALNGIGLEAQDKQSTFTFVMPNAEVHFSAMFTKSEDKIEVSAKDVTNANVSGAENIVSTGNIQLDIDDLDISDEMKAKFEEKAGENEIIQYLDLNLYNIVYKKADGTEVWSDKLEELNEEITVTLYMADDFVAESGTYYIIREHKGEYEELEAVYDKDTNTLTFKTDRFSEYAIAVKTSDNNNETDNKNNNPLETKNPKTGDTVMIYVIMLVVALLGSSIIIIRKKVISKKKNKN